MADVHELHSGIFHPDELGTLNRVVERLCRWHGLSLKSEDATVFASRAMILVGSGLTDESELFRRLRREPLTTRSQRAFAGGVRMPRYVQRRLTRRLHVMRGANNGNVK